MGIKNIFKKKNKYNEEVHTKIESKILYTNDLIEVVHDACKLCYDKPYEQTKKQKIDYVERRVNSGHESILEHTNVISIIRFDKSLYKDYIALSECFRYLNIKTKEDSEYINLLIGGSIRGYKHIVRTIKNGNNPIYKTILNLMYQLPHCFFGDFINENIMNSDKFMTKMQYELLKENPNDPTYEEYYKGKNKNNKILNKNIEVRNIDSANDVIALVSKYGFTDYDIMDMCCINILFKNVSRTTSHQLVRHRAGITQLSQRYVDMKNAKNVSPSEFKEKYKDKRYNIKLNNINNSFTMESLGDELLNVYSQLRNQEVLKEDARRFLPSNVETSLYMTFTFRGFIKFLELRTNKAAQSEIRKLAIDLENYFSTHIINKNEVYDYLLPYYEYCNK